MIIGHIGLIQKSKKQDFVLDVINELSRNDIDVIGLFPGEIRDLDFFEFLKKRVESLKLSDNVLFLGRRNDIPDLLKVMDILLIPSFEGFPLVGLEAAASGVPVVACDAAGAKEFILESKCGITFKEDNVESAVAAILEVLQNVGKYKENGKEFANRMTMDVYRNKILKMMLEI